LRPGPFYFPTMTTLIIGSIVLMMWTMLLRTPLNKGQTRRLGVVLIALAAIAHIIAIPTETATGLQVPLVPPVYLVMSALFLFPYSVSVLVALFIIFRSRREAMPVFGMLLPVVLAVLSIPWLYANTHGS
jgi:hypothetical protein